MQTQNARLKNMIKLSHRVTVYCPTQDDHGNDVPLADEIVNETMAEKFDVVGFVIAFENGELDDESIINGFQHLIDTGICWKLQGSYGRLAKRLIDSGYCTFKQSIIG